MRIVTLILLALMALTVVACNSELPTATPQPTATPTPTPQPTQIPTATPDIEATVSARVQATQEAVPTPTPTPIPTATPNVDATIEAGIEATRTAETALEATVEARIAATQAAIQPTPTPSPTPVSKEERVIRLLYRCFQNPDSLKALGYQQDELSLFPDDWELFRVQMQLAFARAPSRLLDFSDREEQLSLLCAGE